MQRVSSFSMAEPVTTAVRRCLQWCLDNGAMFDFLCHPSCMYVVDPQFRTVELILEMVRRAGDRAALVTIDQIAERYRPRAQLFGNGRAG